MPEKDAKKRVSVTMPRPYLEALDRLVEEGIYLSRGEIILEALRSHLGGRGIRPFSKEKEEEAEEGTK